MCMMLYIGSDNELPLIEWRDGETPICVSALNILSKDYKDDDFFACEYLKKRYKYHIGSWEGCGCGFEFDYSDELYDKDDNDLGKQSVEALFGYIRANVIGGECELLSFWSGDQYKGITHQSNIDLKEFIPSESFSFEEGQYTVVQK